MKKTIFITLFVLSVFMIFTGCSSTLPDGFEETKVTEKAQEIIELTFNDKYETIMEMADDVFNTTITVDDFRSSVNPHLAKAGEFEEITKTVLRSSKNNDTEIAVTISTVKCTNGNLTITIFFDTDMNICGYYVK